MLDFIKNAYSNVLDNDVTLLDILITTFYLFWLISYTALVGCVVVFTLPYIVANSTIGIITVIVMIFIMMYIVVKRYT